MDDEIAAVADSCTPDEPGNVDGCEATGTAEADGRVPDDGGLRPDDVVSGDADPVAEGAAEGPPGVHR